jgi:acyl carrier protein
VDRQLNAFPRRVVRLRKGSSATKPEPILPSKKWIIFRKKRLATIPFLARHIVMQIPQKLKEYIDNNRGIFSPPITDPDQALQIDSLGLIRLVAFLESELGYRLEDEELIAENFMTLRRLGELLATKTSIEPTAKVKPPAQEAIPYVFAKARSTKLSDRNG